MSRIYYDDGEFGFSVFFRRRASYAGVYSQLRCGKDDEMGKDFESPINYIHSDTKSLVFLSEQNSSYTPDYNHCFVCFSNYTAKQRPCQLGGRHKKEWVNFHSYRVID